jgi:hypothetical protein
MIMQNFKYLETNESSDTYISYNKFGLNIFYISLILTSLQVGQSIQATFFSKYPINDFEQIFLKNFVIRTDHTCFIGLNIEVDSFKNSIPRSDKPLLASNEGYL